MGSKPKYEKLVRTLQGWEQKELIAAKEAAYQNRQSLTYFVRDAVAFYAAHCQKLAANRQRKAQNREA